MLVLDCCGKVGDTFYPNDIYIYVMYNALIDKKVFDN